MFPNRTFLSIRRGESAKEPVYRALGIKPDGRWGILGLWSRKGERQELRGNARGPLAAGREESDDFYPR